MVLPDKADTFDMLWTWLKKSTTTEPSSILISIKLTCKKSESSKVIYKNLYPDSKNDEAENFFGYKKMKFTEFLQYILK